MNFRRLLPLAFAFCFFASDGHLSFGQQGPPVTPPAFEPAASPVEQELSLLRQRMDQYEQELRRLHSERALRSDPDDAGVPATSFTNVSAEAPPTTASSAGASGHAPPTENYKRIEISDVPTIKLRGRIHADAGYFDQDEINRAAVGDMENGANFRRARIGAEGRISEVTSYVVEMDFGGSGRPTFADVFIGVHELPILGTVMIGRYEEPFTLEQYSSDNYLTFLERGLLVNAFAPSRNIGIMARNYTEDQSATWAVGVFRSDTDDFGDDVGDNGEHALDIRGTYLPWYDESSEGRYLLHLGAAYSFRDADESVVQFATTPEVRMRAAGEGAVPNFADTGLIPAENFNLFGLESLLIWGPFSLQAEYAAAQVKQIAGPDLFFQGAYVYASYFLTGEHRKYDRRTGAFLGVQPHENFFRVRTGEGVCNGSGAWELAARWSYLDLNDANINGGRLRDVTLGVNWYLNAYTRIMWNYIHAELEGEGHANMFAMRAQVHF